MQHDKDIERGQRTEIPVEAWAITQTDYDPDRPQFWETATALTNGYLGVRGSLPGLNGPKDYPATFVNGIVGYNDYKHIWEFPGFAKRLHAILNLCDWTKLEVTIDGVSAAEYEAADFRRSLDLKRGVLTAGWTWQTPAGAVNVSVERVVSLVHRHQAAQQVTISCESDVILQLDSKVIFELSSPVLAGDISRAELVSDAKACGILISPVDGNGQVGAAFVKTIDGEVVEQSFNDRVLSSSDKIALQSGKTVSLTTFASFHSTLELDSDPVVYASDEVTVASQAGFESIVRTQEEFWSTYWAKADIQIDGNAQDQQAVRFNMFHLRQSNPEDGLRSIGANGQTGDKYCGHVFWDTEMYMLPHYLYTEPETVRSLLMYRYNILDQARARARELNHPGALYSWNSITGEECCIVFEAATAEYHLACAIAWGIHRYMEATGDETFLHQYGAEILFETSRFLVDLGGFVPSKGNQFCINAVCGPDEYACGVNNNCYTNVMAQWHLNYAAEVFAAMKKDAPDALDSLVDRLDLKPEEVTLWQDASDRMYIPFNEELGIHPQDDSYLDLEPVDMSTIPLHTDIREIMHPLNLWRLQVSKQADVVLLMFVQSHQFSLDVKRANYEFYEPRTCHGSSLSACIHSIVAAEIGEHKAAYDFFRQSALMDLDDVKNNTAGGVHSACLGGTWMAVVNGFAGLRDEPQGLSLSPKLPGAWTRCRFKLRYRGRLLGVDLTHDEAKLELIEGDPLLMKLDGKEVCLRVSA